MIDTTVEVYGLTEQRAVYAWRGRGFRTEADRDAFLGRQTRLWAERPLPLYQFVPAPKIVPTGR
jgi:hypothetical protein